MVGINTNVSALNARQSLDTNAVNQSQAMQQLSTGLRINSAKDDAAGLAIATKMGANIRGVAVAVRNANDGISMAQTAESSLGSVTNMLQRMRELAVNASNGTLTSSNRASMQLEVKQLASEIDNIGKTANFNGIKLFDGSAASIALQTNINAGDVVKMGIGAMNSQTMGLGSRSSLQSYGLQATGASASSLQKATAIPGALAQGLSSGDLVINGVTIGSSVAADDVASSNDKESSAISKAAAINKSSALTGVTATANATVASGTSMTASGATATGYFTINGINTGTITTQNNVAIDRATVVAAINQISGSTGVKAVDSGSSTNGVQLIAADGRNISIYNNVNTGIFTAATTGVTSTNVGTAASAMTIFTGTLTLQSNTSSPITIGTTNTGNISRAGFAVGSYAANTSVMTGAGRISSVLSSTATSLSSGDLVVNGVAIGSSLSTDDTLSAGMGSETVKSASAIAIAAAINKKSDLTGVKAVAQANTFTGIGYSVVSTTGNIYLNGVTVAITTTASSKAIDVVNQINNYAGATGVVASDNGLGVTLVAADGRNIELGVSGSTFTLNSLGLNASVGDVASGHATPMITASSAGSAVTTYYAGVNLISDKAFTISAGAGSSANSNLVKLGIAEGTYGGSNNGTKIGSVDISTLAGANDALSAVDAALGQISDQRSNLGAIQNRLQAAVDNLTSSSTNLQAAQGRIQDTDYSVTTTQMSKSQIISQAATAMLAQANQQPQMVLSLLK
jgi:flagellin